VLLGSSGAGKSTLTNALCSQQVADTGANRSGDSRGRHTTTVRSLHVTPQGACIIDTPGLRTLRLDGDAAELETAFDDITRLALQCRFRDCRHEAEPGCAVRAGVPPERLRNYQKLQREARRDTLTALERKAQVSEWKSAHAPGALAGRDQTWMRRVMTALHLPWRYPSEWRFQTRVSLVSCPLHVRAFLTPARRRSERLARWCKAG
jgi:ribosome biogenesis GTPase